MTRELAKMLPALPERERDHVDDAYDAVTAFLRERLPTADQYRAAYAGAQLLRQWARHGIPPACECKQCRDARAPAKKGKRK